MDTIDRVLAEPELRERPPVLVDVGAAGGIHPLWRRLAPHAIGVGFEPDARETAPLAGEQRRFLRWIFVPAVAVSEAPKDGNVPLHLTRSPQCSSTLRPKAAAVRAWAFADFFDVIETRSVPAVTLESALRTRGIEGVDWLKCDTQGTDLRLYRSLPASWRAAMLAVDFEPGLTEIYEGEDRAAEVLAAMAREPFWLATAKIGRTPRGDAAAIRSRSGAAGGRWFRRLGPAAPAWMNLGYLRTGENLDRRGLLLSWVFATLQGQHGHALSLAVAGAERCGGEVWSRMHAESRRRLRIAMLAGVPRWLWQRFGRG